MVRPAREPAPEPPRSRPKHQHKQQEKDSGHFLPHRIPNLLEWPHERTQASTRATRYLASCLSRHAATLSRIDNAALDRLPSATRLAGLRCCAARMLPGYSASNTQTDSQRPT